jgi:flagellar biosynthesis protein FliQ
MALLSNEILEHAGRTMLVAVVPTLAVPLVSLLFAFLQGMMAVREESLQYAVRIIALVAVMAVFGASVSGSLVELMRMALR